MFGLGIGMLLKMGAAVFIVAIISFGAYKYTKLVSNYAQAQQSLILKDQIIKEKEKQIVVERQLREHAELIIEEERGRTETLINELKDVTNNLPEDSNDSAAESIKETLRRLMEMQE